MICVLYQRTCCNFFKNKQPKNWAKFINCNPSYAEIVFQSVLGFNKKSIFFSLKIQRNCPKLQRSSEDDGGDGDFLLLFHLTDWPEPSVVMTRRKTKKPFKILACSSWRPGGAVQGRPGRSVGLIEAWKASCSAIRRRRTK